MHTIAEDLVVLLLDPATGRPLVDSTSFDRVVAGALLLDLSLAGALTPDGEGARAKLLPSGSVPADALLADALDRVSPSPYRAQRAVERLARGRRKQVLERLAAAGAVAARPGRVLGIFPVTTWPATDRSPRPALLAEIGAVLLRRAQPAQRTACLVSLLHAVKAEHKLVDGPRRELRARAEEIAQADWAGPAVRKAVQAVQAAAMAAVTAGAVASGS